METGWRVAALVGGLVALVAVHAATRGAPPWLGVLLAVLAFAVVARAVNALRPSQRRSRQPQRRARRPVRRPVRRGQR